MIPTDVGPFQDRSAARPVPHRTLGGLLLLNVVTFGAFCGVLYVLSPPILIACVAAMVAYSLWTLVDVLCKLATPLPQQ